MCLRKHSFVTVEYRLTSHVEGCGVGGGGGGGVRELWGHVMGGISDWERGRLPDT